MAGEQDVRGKGNRTAQHQQVTRCHVQASLQGQQPSPRTANPTPSHALRGGGWRRISAAKSGTITTDSPVMKPALAGVVRSSPAVWKA